MLKFRVSKSGFYQIAKSIAGDSYDKVYKDIISFMKDLEKKEESKEVKKAIEYFESSESNFSHLEKSVNGDWIEKAGYGVGTIRIWKGKKYKKISASPTRWVRVFDKNDRGAKNAMTRLIHQAEKYKNDPEGMMKLLLENKQRFYNEDSKRYLDIVDRLNAFVDNADSTGPMGENQVKEIHDKIEENKKKGKKVTPYEAQKQIDDEKLMNKVKEINANAKEKEESESKMPDVSKLSRDEILSEMAKQVKLKTNKDEKYYEALRTELDKYNKVAEQLRNEAGEKIDIDNFPLGKIGKKIDGEYPRFNIEQQKKLANRIIEQYGKTDKTRQLLGKLMDFNSQKNQYLPYNPYGDSWDYIESKINIEPKESEPYNPDDPSNKTNPAYKKQFEHTMNRLKAGMSAREKTQMITDAYSMLANDEYSKEGKIVVQADLDAIEQFESEAEKHQNRSNAMMGNKNAYKGGSKEELQNQLLKLTKEKQKNLNQLKKLNNHKLELNNAKYSGIATDKDKTAIDEDFKETEKKINNLEDRNYEIDKEGNELLVSISKMEDEEKTINPLSPKQEKAFTNAIKKIDDELIKMGGGRYSKYKRSNYTINGKPMNIVTDGRILIAQKGHDDSLKDGEITTMEHVYNVGEKPVEIPSGIESVIKNAKKKIDVDGSKLDSSIQFGDYVFNTKYLQMAHDVLGGFDGAKLVGSEDSSKAIRIEKGDISIVLMPIPKLSINEKVIVNSSKTNKELENIPKSEYFDIKKALFNLISMIDDSEDDEFEPDYEDYSDYDASTPELFNSTSYKVADALDECFGCK